MSNENEKIETLLTQINADWLDPCSIGDDGHWAYADNAIPADDFRRRLRLADEDDIADLQAEELASVLANCEEAKASVRAAMVTNDESEADDLIRIAFSLWGCYGDASPLYEIREIVESRFAEEE